MNRLCVRPLGVQTQEALYFDKVNYVETLLTSIYLLSIVGEGRLLTLEALVHYYHKARTVSDKQNYKVLLCLTGIKKNL